MKRLDQRISDISAHRRCAQKVARRATSGSDVIGIGALKVRQDLRAPPARETFSLTDPDVPRLATLSSPLRGACHVWLPSTRRSAARVTSGYLLLAAPRRVSRLATHCRGNTDDKLKLVGHCRTFQTRPIFCYDSGASYSAAHAIARSSEVVAVPR